ncbi:MAG: aminoglycoside phosphotransferase family protein [Eubacteriales bacterium]|nr:aminoglycoside phosphotransferase family protein [Eubacteriales bacterium]
MNLFTAQINNWSEWGDLFQDIETWHPLIEYIFQKENLPFTDIEKLTPGTNAVFKVGETVIKIFAPKEAGMEVGTNFYTELFGMKRANTLSIPAPKLLASGVVDDKYRFRYMVMEFIDAAALGDIEEKLSFDEKVIIGKNLRKITDKQNTPCDDFDPVDVIQNALKNDGWLDYPDSFNTERFAYIADMKISESEKVYCHGDLNPDNIFVDDNLDLYLIDFADAMYAPAGYEQALIACELFCFEKPYMTGYFGDYAVDEIARLCATWLPVHDSGEHTLRCNIGPASEITSFKVMRERLHEMIKSEKARAL